MNPTFFQSLSALTFSAVVVVVAGLAAVMFIMGRIRARNNADIGSILAFKCLYPQAIRPEGSYPFLLFISALQTGAPTLDKRSDIVEVTIQRQIERTLHKKQHFYRENNVTSSNPIPNEKYLTYKIKAPGLRFDPQDTTRLHDGKLVTQPFTVMADRELDGKTIRGTLKVRAGWFTVAELGFEIRVSSAAECDPFEISSAPIQRDIFPSYARADAAYLETFEELGKAFGDEYMSDVKRIRAGTEWPTEIESLITQADLFQLFWSKNAAKSTYIPKELDYALALNRSDFIYATICEDDAPPPPESLRKRNIQVVNVSLERKKQKVRNKQRAYLFAPLISLSGSSANGAVPAFALAGGVLAGSVALAVGANAILKRNRVVPSNPPAISTPSPTPLPTPSPTPPPIVDVNGRVVGADNEGVADVVVMLCAEQQPGFARRQCISVTSDRAGSFSFSGVDKGKQHSVTASAKDRVCTPRTQTLTNFDVQQQLRFVCRKIERPSPTPSPTVSPTASPTPRLPNVETSAVLDHRPTKEGESAVIRVQIKNVGGRTATNIRVNLQLPAYVQMVHSRVAAKQSKGPRGTLFLEYSIPSLDAGQEQQWETKIILIRDLKPGESCWVEKGPTKWELK